MRADQSQFHFAIASLPDSTFSLQQFAGAGAIAEDYSYTIVCNSAQELAVNALLGQRASLILDTVAGQNKIHGLIAQVNYLGPMANGAAYAYEFHLVSFLYDLKQRQSAKIYLKKTIPEIIKEILLAANWVEASFNFQLAGEYCSHAMVTQLNETDFDFMLRLMSQAGLLFYFLQNEENPQLVVFDDITQLPRFINNDLSFNEENGLVAAAESIFNFNEQAQLLPQQIKCKDYNDKMPNKNLMVTQKASVGYGEYYDACLNYADVQQGQNLAFLALQNLNAQRQLFIAKTTSRSLKVGDSFTFQHPENSVYNGDYRVIRLEMTGNQINAGQPQADTARTYEAKCWLIKATQVFKLFPQQEKAFLHTIPARIESRNNNDSIPYLDEQGQYHGYFPFDQNQNNQIGQRSRPLRFLQHHSGELDAAQIPTGKHFPLRAQTQVLTGFVQADLNRPVILGALPNAENPTTANTNNASQNILRTFSGNELNLEDQAESPLALLATKNQLNRLVLNATENQQSAQLVSEKGSLSSYAKKTKTVQAGGSLQQKAAQNHSTLIKNSQKVLTKNLSIQHQAGNHLQLNTKQHLQTKSQADTLIQSAQSSQLNTNNNFSTQIQNGDLQLQTEQGSLHIQSQQNILLHGAGQSQMQVGQPSGGMFIAPEGNVYLSSPQLTLEAPEINIYGMHGINSQSPSFQYVPASQLKNEKDKDDKKKKKKKETDDPVLKEFIATVYGETLWSFMSSNGKISPKKHHHKSNPYVLSSPKTWVAVASVIMNRANGTPGISKPKPIEEILAHGFDAYTFRNKPGAVYQEAMDFMNANPGWAENPQEWDGQPTNLYNLAKAVIPYYKKTSLPSNDAVAYFSPRAQQYNYDKNVSGYSKNVQDVEAERQSEGMEIAPVDLEHPRDDFEFFRYTDKYKEKAKHAEGEKRHRHEASKNHHHSKHKHHSS